MFSINLLSAYEKKIVRTEEARRGVVFFSGLALIIFVAGGVLLIPSFVLTRRATGEMSRALALEEESARRSAGAEAIAKIRAVRDVLGAIRAHADEPSRASSLLMRFIAPGPGITIRSFIIHGDGLVALTGHAKTRADMLGFEEGLRASNRFYEIAFPLSNITRERDIQFSAQGKLKQEHGL